MQPLPPKPRHTIGWKHLIYLICMLVIVTWWIETPDGLLSKADSIGFAVCHRIDIRSFTLDGQPMPLCARCSGMYLGAVAGILFQMIFYPRRGGLPGWKTGIPFMLFVLAFSVDGLNSYLHLFPGVPGAYEPHNWLRLLTGTGMGISIAAMLVPAFHQTVWGKWDQRSIYSSWQDYMGLIGSAFAFSALTLIENSIIRYFLAIISAIGVILVLCMVYSMICLMVFRRDNRAEKWQDLLPALSVGIINAIAQIGVIDWIRFAWTGTWSGFKF